MGVGGLVVVVGIRNAADGSYFLLMREGVRDAGLEPGAEGGELVTSAVLAGTEDGDEKGFCCGDICGDCCWDWDDKAKAPFGEAAGDEE